MLLFTNNNFVYLTHVTHLYQAFTHTHDFLPIVYKDLRK